jgi:hypothetical protein
MIENSHFFLNDIFLLPQQNDSHCCYGRGREGGSVCVCVCVSVCVCVRERERERGERHEEGTTFVSRLELIGTLSPYISLILHESLLGFELMKLLLGR